MSVLRVVSHPKFPSWRTIIYQSIRTESRYESPFSSTRRGSPRVSAGFKGVVIDSLGGPAGFRLKPFADSLERRHTGQCHEDASDSDSAVTEISILEQVQHPNVVQLLDVWFLSQKYTLVLKHGGVSLRVGRRGIVRFAAEGMSSFMAAAMCA